MRLIVEVNGMPLQPIGRSSTGLADEAYRRISEAMLRGDIPPGSRLVMDDLAERLDISRTPVRDALRRLEREGLVNSAGRKGYTVRAIAADDLANLYDARIAVEVHAAMRVAAGGEAAVNQVAEAIEAAADMAVTAPAEAYAANRMVHRAVAEAAGNPLLVELFDSIWNRAKAFQIFEQFHHLDMDQAANLNEHRKIVEAMRESPECAAAVMREHIGVGLDTHHPE